MKTSSKQASVDTIQKVLDGPNTGTYKISKPWTWRDRVRAKLFPYKPCNHPDINGIAWTPLDVVICKNTVCLTFIDRIRVLISGKVCVETRTVTQYLIGDHRTSAASYVAHPGYKPEGIFHP